MRSRLWPAGVPPGGIAPTGRQGARGDDRKGKSEEDEPDDEGDGQPAAGADRRCRRGKAREHRHRHGSRKAAEALGDRPVLVPLYRHRSLSRQRRAGRRRARGGQGPSRSRTTMPTPRARSFRVYADAVISDTATVVVGPPTSWSWQFQGRRPCDRRHRRSASADAHRDASEPALRDQRRGSGLQLRATELSKRASDSGGVGAPSRCLTLVHARGRRGQPVGASVGLALFASD